jgi:hypothetical protein
MTRQKFATTMLLFLLIMSAVGCGTEDAALASQIEPEDCDKILVQGIRDTIDLSDLRKATETFRQLSDDFFSEHQDYTLNNSSGLSVGIGKISIGGSNDLSSHKLYDLMKKVHEERDYELTRDEAFTLSVKVANPAVVQAWEHCMELAAQGRGRIRLIVSDTESTPTTLVARVSLPARFTKPPIIQAVTIRGGSFEAGTPEPKNELVSDEKFFIRRIVGEELLVVVRTNGGTASILRAKEAPPVPKVDTAAAERAWKAYDEAVAKREDELRILRMTHTFWAGKEEGRGANKGTSPSLKISATRRFRDDEHICGFIMYYGGDPARPHNIAFLIRRPDGSVYSTGPLLPGEGGGWAAGNPNAAHVTQFSNPDTVIAAVKEAYQGKDFDGWVFAITGGGGVSARLAGGPRHGEPSGVDGPIRYGMPILPEGYEWELASVHVDGGRWLNGAEFTFRPCFTDRERQIRPEPQPPKMPRPSK